MQHHFFRRSFEQTSSHFFSFLRNKPPLPHIPLQLETGHHTPPFSTLTSKTDRSLQPRNAIATFTMEEEEGAGPNSLSNATYPTRRWGHPLTHPQKKNNGKQPTDLQKHHVAITIEICRVCRSEGSPEQPLYHPCKCSGSIRFVHQDW
jgi:hypothetical protein